VTEKLQTLLRETRGAQKIHDEQTTNKQTNNNILLHKILLINVRLCSSDAISRCHTS